ncbi:MAG: hypothetical protein ACR2PO_17965 [Methyloligellaceae bacterium]
MSNQSQTPRLLAAALAVLAGTQLLAFNAQAAKEKFERTKPHVNVGTIGQAEPGRIAPGPNAFVPQPILTPRPGLGIGAPMPPPGGGMRGGVRR